RTGVGLVAEHGRPFDISCCTQIDPGSIRAFFAWRERRRNAAFGRRHIPRGRAAPLRPITCAGARCASQQHNSEEGTRCTLQFHETPRTLHWQSSSGNMEWRSSLSSATKGFDHYTVRLQYKRTGGTKHVAWQCPRFAREHSHAASFFSVGPQGDFAQSLPTPYNIVVILQ